MRRAVFASLLLMFAMSSHATERALDKEVLVPAPVDAVWQSWTSKAGIESFFAPEAEIEPRVGGAFHIHIDPYGAPGMKGADDMRFMALQRERLAGPGRRGDERVPAGLDPGHAGCWALVGASNADANHDRTAGWKSSSAATDMRMFKTAGRRRPYCTSSSG